MNALRFSLVAAFLFAVATLVAAPGLHEEMPQLERQPAAAARIIDHGSSATTTIDQKIATSTTERAPAPGAKQVRSAATATNVAATSSIQKPRETPRPNSYPSPPISVEEANARARAALVNIFCVSNGALQGVSGSGVIIDSRGVILTNAHVAQYVLLSQDPRAQLSCMARTGAPAAPRWDIEVLYLPPVWVTEHGKEFGKSGSLGTGEHDWALLFMTRIRGPERVPILALPFDTREGAASQSDQALVVSYPAEFVGALAAQRELYPVTSVTTIGKPYTFTSATVDVLSLGGVIGAQGGSSGGGAINVWGRLIGLITTTSEGKTTAERDLHAITLGYIDRDIRAQTGLGIAQFLEGDLATKQNDFEENVAPALTKRLLDALGR